MTWTQLTVAFLAGYGLMSLVLWLMAFLGRMGCRPLTTSALVLAGDDRERIEGILRILHGLWEEDRLLEVIVAANGADEETRAIADRMTRALPSLVPMPAGTDLYSALQTTRGETAWIIDLGRIRNGNPIGLNPPRLMWWRHRNRWRVGR